MKFSLRFVLMPCLFSSVLFAADNPLQDFNGDGRADLVLRNKATGDNKVWFMNGTTKSSETPISPSPVELGWSIRAVGDFNGDGNSDLVWQKDGLDYAGVWLMNGATMMGYAPWFQPTGDPNWRIVAAGDFGSVINGNPNAILDGNVDVVWQHEVTGQKAMWFMGQAPTANAPIPMLWAGLIEGATADPSWHIVAAGDFGNGTFGTGISVDLVLQNYQTRESAIWWMEQKRIMSGDYTRDATIPGYPTTLVDDEDWRICAAAHFDTAGNSDLFLRYTPIALNEVWFMSSQYFLTQTDATHLKDPAWRFGHQTLQDTLWRQAAFEPTITATATSSSITLNFKIPESGVNNLSITRRELPGGVLMTNVTGYTDSIYTDSSTQPYKHYEYAIFRENGYGMPKYKIQTGYQINPYTNPGTVVLAIDQTVKTGISASLNIYKNDLIADGWNIVEMDVPRRKENWPDNVTSIGTIRTNLAAAFNDPQNPATCAVLIGHVPIPYSGAAYHDNHPSHAGAWPADMYYADIDGIWIDTNVNIINYTYAENTNIPDDGKWDNDYAPSPVELAIGRIDFARLPAFGADVGDVPAPAEIVLLNQYFSKNHNYRNNLPPYPLNPKGVAAATLSQTFPNSYIDSVNYIYNEAARNCSALFGDILQTVEIGDPYEQKSESFVWGFASGKGRPNGINDEAPFSRHYSSDLANGEIEAPIAFYSVYGSYFGDWNMEDNFMRSTIATPNYGLAIMWDLPQTRWRFESMALGNYLGDCWRTMINDPEYMDSEFGVDHKYRELAIMGDPTLRLNY